MYTKTKANLDTLLAISNPTEYEYEEIAKCYQELGGYAIAVHYLEKAFESLRELSPDGEAIRDPYEARRRICEEKLEQLEKNIKS